jgi:hypothetical protein
MMERTAPTDRNGLAPQADTTAGAFRFSGLATSQLSPKSIIR